MKEPKGSEPIREPKECPQCHSITPEDAPCPECGNDFADQRSGGSSRRHPAPRAFGCGLVLAPGVSLVSFGLIVGAVIGIHLRVASAAAPAGACGLWIVGVIAEGLIVGALLGALAGGAATVLVVLGLRRPV